MKWEFGGDISNFRLPMSNFSEAWDLRATGHPSNRAANAQLAIGNRKSQMSLWNGFIGLSNQVRETGIRAQWFQMGIHSGEGETDGMFAFGLTQPFDAVVNIT
jgi:hypothetical protein